MGSFIVDIGGEERHLHAWNLNPRSVKAFGPRHGCPIPRLIIGRADSVPLPSKCVDIIIVERTPLSRHALVEIGRIAKHGATIILRHARPFGRDPHLLAKQMLSGESREGECEIGQRRYQETIIKLIATKVEKL